MPVEIATNVVAVAERRAPGSRTRPIQCWRRCPRRCWHRSRSQTMNSHCRYRYRHRCSPAACGIASASWTLEPKAIQRMLHYKRRGSCSRDCFQEFFWERRRTHIVVVVIGTTGLPEPLRAQRLPGAGSILSRHRPANFSARGAADGPPIPGQQTLHAAPGDFPPRLFAAGLLWNAGTGLWHRILVLRRSQQRQRDEPNQAGGRTATNGDRGKGYQQGQSKSPKKEFLLGPKADRRCRQGLGSELVRVPPQNWAMNKQQQQR
mmetsp:Transcript_9852/g.21227  ORF Transcript_9852/g.21227 Transcript_9852/m.21227 type:complete len:262 (-) Transcript_9852:204-989(-)